MALFKKKPKDAAPEISAPEPEVPAAPETGEPEKGGLLKKLKKKKPRKAKKSTRVMRVEELENRLAAGEDFDDIDPNAVISAYIPRRRVKTLAHAIMRLDKARITLLAVLLAVASLFILAFMQEKMGNFTINLNRLELFRKGVSISETGDFQNATSRLTANSLRDATNISLSDLPRNLNQLDGDNSGLNYMSYTYYLRNAGKEDLSYIARLTMDACSKGAENAVRVVLWVNDDDRVVYATPGRDGKPEEGCENFESETVVCTLPVEEFRVGDVYRYTIAIFMEGEDPDCVDSIVGGSVQFSMKIDAEGLDDRSLFLKFLEDLRDSVTGNRPINAGGVNAPDYYLDRGNITWQNRRNQEGRYEETMSEDALGFAKDIVNSVEDIDKVDDVVHDVASGVADEIADAAVREAVESVVNADDPMAAIENIFATVEDQELLRDIVMELQGRGYSWGGKAS